MQHNIFYLGCLAQPAKAFATGKRNRAAARKDLGRIVQEDLVYHAGCQGRPVYQRATFNEQTGNSQFTQTYGDLGEVGAAIARAQWDLFHTNTTLFQEAAF